MKRPAFRFLSLAAVVLCLVLSLPSGAQAGPKVYWHFTIKAFVDMPNLNGVEWAWVTMVEFDWPQA